jgi:hypothetical protein
MSLIDFTHGKFVKAINTANNAAFSINDFVFSKPRVNSAGYIGGNTLIRMQPRNRDTYDGSTVFGYDRLDLSVLSTATGGVLAVPETVTDPYAMLPYLHQNYGIGVAAHDLTASIDMKGATESYTLSRLFNTGYNHSANTTKNINAVPAEQTSWTYASDTKILTQPTDATAVSGIITPEAFSDYVLDVTLGGNTDNGFMGIILAAYWDSAAGQMCTLTCDMTLAASVIPNIQYNFGQSLSGTLGGFAAGTVTSRPWVQAGTRRVRATRVGDIITVEVYGFSIVQDGNVVYGTKVVDLNSDARLLKFKTAARVGVITRNNAGGYFKNFLLSAPARLLTLTASPDNHYFTGTADFVIAGGSALTETPYTYDPVVHTVDHGKTFAETYRWPLNMTAEKTTMQTLTASTIDFKALAVALQKVTGDTWKFSGIAPYSLEDAIIRKVGTAQATWGVSTAYTYAVVIELSSACTALEGNLLLHFN